MDILQYLDRPGVHERALLPAGDIPFSAMAVEACRANMCGRYGTCWTCPPGVGEAAEWERRIKSYRDAAVFTCTYALEDSFDFKGMVEGGKKTAALLREIMAELRRDGVPFLALGCEGCGLCPTCSYPDAPCRHPEEAVVSVEACGIYVVELARQCGIRYNNGPDTVTYFCILLFG